MQKGSILCRLLIIVLRATYTMVPRNAGLHSEACALLYLCLCPTLSAQIISVFYVNAYFLSLSVTRNFGNKY